MDAQEIYTRAQELRDKIIAIRQDLHRYPELSYHEEQTAAYIAARLRGLGLIVEERVNGYGVVGLLAGRPDGRTVALRADIDALPLTEANDLPYRSTNPGVMHACGHDGHVAMALGAATLLAERRESLPGNVKFIFQPAEETPPEGGAKGMIAAGVLHNPDVDAILGAHIWPDIPAGEIAVKAGPIMAEADRFELRLYGKGGHGAAPHHTVDTLVIAAQVILALQTLVSRKVDPLKPVVLSVCQIHGGMAYNIIPDEIRLEGTTRYFEPEIGNFLEEQIRQVVHGICQSYGGSYEMNYQYGFPPTVNNAEIASILARSAGEILGEAGVHWIEEPSMTGEDFSYFLQQIPGCFFWLGTGNPAKGIDSPLHSSSFRIDENILSQGTAILCNAVLKILNGG